MSTGIVGQALREKLALLVLQAREWKLRKAREPWEKRTEKAIRELKQEIGKWEYWEI